MSGLTFWTMWVLLVVYMAWREHLLRRARRDLEAAKKKLEWLQATETHDQRRERALLVKGMFVSAVLQGLARWRPSP